ncbi:hypothetical protein DUI87_14493 [Hirundo rustica rustica]|uniref:Uncharacterized protein n=1 Tax=Hirundo rustica rustica TaxID=333673 RepID=A0A3M0K4X3_HIRRU|nr:hypothetical protein DUI87_14493 [Hirundo rustica rustica]
MVIIIIIIIIRRQKNGKNIFFCWSITGLAWVCDLSTKHSLKHQSILILSSLAVRQSPAVPKAMPCMGYEDLFPLGMTSQQNRNENPEDMKHREC